jgi:hypothetical protein
MLTIVAVSGDLFRAAIPTRLTIEHVHHKLLFRSLVGPDPVIEDLEGRCAIIHPAHVEASLVVNDAMDKQRIPGLVEKTVRLLLHCPGATLSRKPLQGRSFRSARGRKRTGRLISDPGTPFYLGARDFFALIHVKPACPDVDYVFGVLGRNRCRKRRARPNDSPASISQYLP